MDCENKMTTIIDFRLSIKSSIHNSLHEYNTNFCISCTAFHSSNALIQTNDCKIIQMNGGRLQVACSASLGTSWTMDRLAVPSPHVTNQSSFFVLRFRMWKAHCLARAEATTPPSRLAFGEWSWLGCSCGAHCHWFIFEFKIDSVANAHQTSWSCSPTQAAATAAQLKTRHWEQCCSWPHSSITSNRAKTVPRS